MTSPKGKKFARGARVIVEIEMGINKERGREKKSMGVVGMTLNVI